MKKLLNNIRKFKVLSVILTVAVIFGLVVSESNVSAGSSYVYDFWKNVIPSSEGITYKETYYNKDILNLKTGESLYDNNILTKTEETVSDMEVHNQKIYLLHIYNEEGVKIPTSDPSGNGFKMSNVGQLIVINQNFQYEQVLSKFEISDYAKQKLDDFYRFNTPLDKITEAQVNSTEYVTVKNAVEVISPVEAGKVLHFDSFTYDGTNDAAELDLNILVEVEIRGKKQEELQKIPSENYVLSIEEITVKDEAGKEVKKSITKVQFNNNYQISEGTNVYAHYKTIETVGRAPYIPYEVEVEPGVTELRPFLRLKNPQGVTVTDDAIFIADTENARILKLNHNYVVEDVYLTPDDSTFYQMYNSSYDTKFGPAYEKVNSSKSGWYTELYSGIIFAPQKVAVNPSGVCYCISKNTYQGLIEFGANTEFNRFVGKNTVTTSALKQLWSNIWTDEQYASQALDLPSMFNNIAVSPDGFLYATANPDSDATQVKNLVQVINSKGNDIMKRNGYVTPDGDAVYITTTNDKGVITGPSILTAVAVSNDGNFTVCDQKRGRLFTYDSEGNLLYITGEQPGGSQNGGTGNGLSHSIIDPIALDYLYRTNDKGEEEETLIVLDRYSKSIILFETTEFGRAVNKATSLYQNGILSDTYKVDENGNYVLDEDGNKIVLSEGAETYWRKVIKMNTNYELAYLGIGKALNLRGEFKEAMKYFELAHSSMYYSKAFSSYRDQVLNENFNLIMTVILVFIGGVVVKHVLKIVNENNKKTAMKGDDE